MEDGQIPITNFTLSSKEKETKSLKGEFNLKDFEGSLVLSNFDYAKDCGFSGPSKDGKTKKHKK